VPQTALDEYRAAVRRSPNDPGALAGLAHILVRCDRTAEAVPYLERAADIDRRSSRYVELARALAELHRTGDAIKAFRQAQQLSPDDGDVAFGLGSALQADLDHRGAVAEFERAIVLNAVNPAFHLALGRSLEQLDRRSEAASAYTEYLRLAPSAADATDVRTRIARLSRSAPPVPAL
jgi:cytochrome c-type biogenesis protein CcmH/NrfG